MRPAEGAVVETAHQVRRPAPDPAGRRRARARGPPAAAPRTGRRRRRRAPMGGARSGTCSTSQLAPGPPNAMTAAAAAGWRRWRRSRPTSTSAGGRQPAAAATASHSASSTGHSATTRFQRRAAATGSSGRGSIGGGRSGASGGRGVAPHRRGHDGGRHGSEQAGRGRGADGVGHEIGHRPGWQLGRVAPIGAEQRDGDQLVPGSRDRRRVAHCCAHAALTNEASARGPMSSTRSGRNTASGTRPDAVHSALTATGCPPDAASSTATASSVRSLAIGSDPVWSLNAQPPPPSVGAARRTTGTRSDHGSRASRPTDLGQRVGHGGGLDRLVADRAGAASPYRSPTIARAAGAGIAVQVGGDHGAHRQRCVERLAVGGERQHHRRGTGVETSQPGATDLDEVLADVAATDHQPAVGDRRRRLDVGATHLPAARRGDRVGERSPGSEGTR